MCKNSRGNLYNFLRTSEDGGGPPLKILQNKFHKRGPSQFQSGEGDEKRIKKKQLEPKYIYTYKRLHHLSHTTDTILRSGPMTAPHGHHPP